MTGSCVFPFSPFPKLVWNQWASPVSCHLLFSSPSILLLSFPLSHFSPYFSRQLSASCHCSRTMQVQVPFWVCVCARVCVCYCKWHSDIPATTGWMCGPSTLCLFRPLLYTFWEGGGQSMCACVRACLCVCEQRHLRHTPYHNTDSAATTGTRWRLFSSQSVCFSSLSPAGCRKTPGGTARRGDGPMDVWVCVCVCLDSWHDTLSISTMRGMSAQTELSLRFGHSCHPRGKREKGRPKIYTLGL